MSARYPHPWRLATELLAFVCLSALLTAVVISSVLDLDATPTHTYHALFSDASGLSSGDDVVIAGIAVGKVSSVRLFGASQVRVTFALDTGHVVAADTYAEVEYANLLGQRNLTLTLGPGGGSRPLRPGSTIPQAHTVPAIDLTAVFNGFQPLFAVLTPQAINQLTGSIIDIFQGQSGTVADLIDQIAQISVNLADRRAVVQEVITNLAGLLDSVAGQGQQLGALVDNFDRVVDNVAGERAVLSSTIAALSTFTGTAAALTTTAAPAIDQDVQGVARAAQTLAANQGPIDQLLAGAPSALQAITGVVDAGSYFRIYVCNLTLDVTGSLNLSLVPGLAAPQPPSPVSLEGAGGVVGSPTAHTQVCQ